MVTRRAFTGLLLGTLAAASVTLPARVNASEIHQPRRIPAGHEGCPIVLLRCSGFLLALYPAGLTTIPESYTYLGCYNYGPVGVLPAFAEMWGWQLTNAMKKARVLTANVPCAMLYIRTSPEPVL